MEEEDNRWARPVLHDVEWKRKDGYPAWLSEDRVQRGLAGKFDRPVLVIVGGDPMLHSVNESDGNPSLVYWRASVYLLQTNPEGIEGTRFSSLCLFEEGDTQDGMREDLMNRVVNFITKCAPNTKVAHVS